MKGNKKRTSAIWGLSKEEFEKLVKKSRSYREILRFFEHDNKIVSHKILKQRIKEDEIDSSHIENIRKNQLAIIKVTIPLEKILVENSNYNRTDLKKRLIKNNLLEYKCHKCGLKNEWNGEKLSLQLDHINGKPKDNRLDNLRFLCPNCHSQTKYFAGKSLKNIINCPICGRVKKTKQSVLCNDCFRKKKRELKYLPDKEELQSMINSMSWVAIGKKYEVSDNTIRNLARYYGIIWEKRQYNKQIK